MEFKKEIIINKSPEAVWEVLGNQFNQVCRWASGVYQSETFGNSQIQEADFSNRACELPSGKIKEQLLKFNPNQHILEYEVIEGFPGFVKSAVNHWKLTKSGRGTRVNMHLRVETQGILGTLMKPMLKMQMNGIANQAIADLKHFVETGQPSPKKQKELNKLAAKAA